MVGIQAVYLIALYIFQYRGRIRHVFITALENDTKYLRRKNKFIYCPDSSMLRLPSYVYKNTRYTITHYYFCKLLNKPFIYLHVCKLTYRRPSILKGWGWLPAYLYILKVSTLYLLQLPTCVFLVNDIIDNCLCRIPLVPCPCYMIYAVGQPCENCWMCKKKRERHVIDTNVCVNPVLMLDGFWGKKNIVFVKSQ